MKPPSPVRERKCLVTMLLLKFLYENMLLKVPRREVVEDGRKRILMDVGGRWMSALGSVDKTVKFPSERELPLNSYTTICVLWRVGTVEEYEYSTYQTTTLVSR